MLSGLPKDYYPSDRVRNSARKADLTKEGKFEAMASPQEIAMSRGYYGAVYRAKGFLGTSSNDFDPNRLDRDS